MNVKLIFFYAFQNVDDIFYHCLCFLNQCDYQLSPKKPLLQQMDIITKIPQQDKDQQTMGIPGLKAASTSYLKEHHESGIRKI